MTCSADPVCRKDADSALGHQWDVDTALHFEADHLLLADMAAAAFFGHALLGIGPGIAFFCVIIAPKSFVVLLSLFSAFLWLVVMLLTSALLRGFVPITTTQPAYAGVLLAAVAVEEVARYGVWQLHKKTVAVLHRMSESSGHTFTPVDEMYLAVGWGYGQAAVHVLILFGSLLPLTAGHGTLYAATCPQASTS